MYLSLGNISKKVITNFSIPVARDNLPGLESNLVSNTTSNIIKTFERKISGKGTHRSGKWCTLFILNEDMNDIFKIISDQKIRKY